MAGSLDTWASKPPSGAEVADRLIALAQSLNGLQFLYEHGFEGHGDLKPSNLLYDDLSIKFQLGDSETWPSTAHPWRIRVADLGWADAWVDLGLSTKALRTHMAPERFEAIVVPVKSDIFSMGIIAAELLQGQHPADNLKARTKSEGNWIRWVTDGTRNLSGVTSTKLQAVIRKCLSASPDARPDALEFLNEVCIELKTTFSIDIAQTLELWRSGAAGDDNVVKNEQFAWAAKQSPRLGITEAEVSRMQLAEKLSKIDVVDFKSCEEWAPLADALLYLIAENHETRRHIRNLASEYLVSILGRTGRSELAQLGVRSDLPTLRPFERYSALAGTLADIAELTLDNGAVIEKQLDPYAKSALRYSTASKLWASGKNNAAIEKLSDSIAEAPDEPTFYYFRALWAYMTRVLLRTVRSHTDTLEPPDIDDIARDLKKAIRLEPDWEEPKRLLGSLHR